MSIILLFAAMVCMGAIYGAIFESDLLLPIRVGAILYSFVMLSFVIVLTLTSYNII